MEDILIIGLDIFPKLELFGTFSMLYRLEEMHSGEINSVAVYSK